MTAPVKIAAVTAALALTATAAAAGASPLEASIGFETGMGGIDDPHGPDPLLATFGLRGGIGWCRLQLLGGLDFVAAQTAPTSATDPGRYAAGGRAMLGVRLAVHERRVIDDQVTLRFSVDASAGEIVHQGGPAAALGERDLQLGASAQFGVTPISVSLGVMLLFPDGRGPAGAIVSGGYRWGRTL